MQCVGTGSGFHMYYVPRLLLGCSIVALSACSTMTIELDHDASANFSNLKTYAWVSRAKRDPILTRINDEFVESRGGTRTRVYDFDQGLLVLDIVDPQTKKLIWRGTAKDAVDLSWSQQRKTAKISEAVQKMLSRFPPK